jgi:hypothetical protein
MRVVKAARPQALRVVAESGRGRPVRLRPRRECHLLDVENLLGRGQFTASDVAELSRQYSRVTRLARDAQLVAAASSSLWVEIGRGWPGVRPLWQPGPDGADECLLEVIRDEHLADRFSRVVIASGDGIFAKAARELVDLGVDVVVVGQYGHIHHLLYSAVADIRYLPYDEVVAARAA